MAPSPLAGSFRPAERIFVPVQGSDREFLAQQWAVEFAAALALPVTAVHVAGADEPADDEVFTFLLKACEKWGVEATTRVLSGEDVVGELVEEMGPRDLVVVGTQRLAHHYHVGSVARELVRRAPCPVQIVRLE